GLTNEEYDNIIHTIEQIDQLINHSVAERGLIHVDGKKEFAFDDERRLMIVDVFGTADEDRFWDASSYERGEFVERSKEVVRRYYRDIGYHTLLYEAREKGEPEPPIPPLPDDMIEKTSQVYIELFEQLTGESFR
ncbi:MAG: phosphoribosylaminoimidazolesuccinocarboxamide synthase, partial [Methermicoccaceae archaeon]